jgi:hypothetical protein
MVWKSVFDEIKGERTWRKQRKVYFFVKIAGTKRANGWVSVLRVKNGIRL